MQLAVHASKEVKSKELFMTTAAAAEKKKVVGWSPVNEFAHRKWSDEFYSSSAAGLPNGFF
jgi:hypothetical protein